MPNNPTAVLPIEDNLDDVLLMKAMFRKERRRAFGFEHAGSLSAGLARLAEGGIDVVLLDLSLPDSTGADTFHRVQAQASDLPIMVLTGLDDDELGDALVKDGAQNYLTKGQVGADVLVRSIRYAIERKRTEQKLRELDRMKTQFIDSISHELRTPLHSIMGFSSLMMNGKVADPDTQRRFLSRINILSQNLATLIDDLLDASRVESGRFSIEKQSLSVQRLIDDVVDDCFGLAHENDVTIASRVPQSLPEIDADEGRLKQVMVNLLSNVVKFSDTGTEITITAEVTDQGIVVQVADQGVGVSDEAMPQLFERFYRADNSTTRESEGTGIGLYISKQIVEAHDGSIWIKSELGKGSTVSFSLPANV